MADDQINAINKTKGPCIILAGAGTGKTYTIVEKIKYLIEKKIYSPEKIVCITFSNEAVNNLMSRIRKKIEFEDSKEPIIKTFHAFGAELLRNHGKTIGINKDFKVLTPDEAKVVLHRYLKVNIGNCHSYISAIGNAKDLGINIENIKEYLDMKITSLKNIDIEKKLEFLQFELKTLYLRGKNTQEKRKLSAEIKKLNDFVKLRKFTNAWSAYEKLKKLKNYQDYSDLNKNALQLLKKERKVAEKYDYIIVDEFQDTNKIQLDFLCNLAVDKNVTVVGDLNQSIYRFRGAYRKNFDEFKDWFKVNDNDIYNLDKSYRSSNKILRAAHKLISENYTKKNECFEVLHFDNKEGENIEVYEILNSNEEARKVIDIINKELKSGNEMRNICVMFRTHQQGRLIKRALEFAKLPFVSINKISLLKEKSIKIVIDYLTLLNKLKQKENGGEQSWWDLLYLMDFSDSDLIKVGRFIKDNKNSVNLSVLFLNSLEEIDFSEDGKMAAKILIEKIKILIPSLKKEVSELIKNIYSISGLINSQKTKEEKIVMKNLHKFYELGREHSIFHNPSLASFINYLEILDGLKIEIPAEDSEKEGIRLMTSHATKGLEYDTVIVTNLAQKRFPIEKYSSGSLIPLELSPEFNVNAENDGDMAYYISENEKKNQLFEERRLCYVAFTRAKEKLILTFANEYGGKKHYPSQFLQEINYKENNDIIYHKDTDEKYIEEDYHKNKNIDIKSIVDKENFDSLINEVIKTDRVKSFKDVSFSPSSLLCFEDCEKRYEYRYVYNMPEPKNLHWEAMLLGSFVHKVLEEGVYKCFNKLKDFEDLAKEICDETLWEGVNMDEALHLIKVFFARNKNKYSEKSVTEQHLKMELGGMMFNGFADRIDFLDNGIGIVDYKTGKSIVPLRARNWQMGYYALAASKLGKVKKITLDMLMHETPLEFVLDDKGNAKAVNSSRMNGFNIYDVEQELVKTAHKILDARKNGFKPCPIEKNCEFCNEWIWKL